MTIDIAGYMFAMIAIGMSFVSARSSYYPLKIVTGLCWLVVAFFWLANTPTGIAKDSPANTAIIITLFFISIAFMFFAFWTTKSGQEVGRGFRLHFTHSEEDEEAERQRSYQPDRYERNMAYRSKVNSALRGERRRRY